jgi:PKD repeat protein
MKKLFTPFLMSLILLVLNYSGIKAQTYCTPTWSNYGSWNMGFTNVQVGSINNTSGTPTAAGASYWNYTNLSTSATLGSSVNYSITLGPTYGQWVCIWIDFNNDGSFTTSGDLVAQMQTSTGGYTFTGSFTIPTGAQGGSHRMRLMTEYYGMSTYPTPCSASYAGECEDYTIVCGTPTPQVVDSIKVVTLDTNKVFISQNYVKTVSLNVYTTGSLNPKTLNRIYFSTSPSTSASDITKARLFKNNNTPLSITDTIGAPVVAPNGGFYFDVGKTLIYGTNSFVLAYDLSLNAVENHRIDARCDSIVLSNVTSYPAIPSPAGSRRIVTNANYDMYCGHTRSQQLNYAVGTIRIILGNINYVSGTPPGPNVYDFYTGAIPTLNYQKTYPMSISAGTLNSNQTATVYIDWNNDGYFGTGETAIQVSQPAAGTTVSNLTIPCNATPGYHRLRVVSDLGSYAPSCGVTNYGECEDYIILIPEEKAPVVSWTTDSTNYAGGNTRLTPVTNLNGVIKYYWDLNNDGSIDDSTSSPNEIYVHKFMTSGNVTVSMFAKLFGCTATYTSNKYVGVVKIVMPSSPSVNFIASLNSVTPQIPTILTDLTTEGPYKWKWRISPAKLNGQSTYTISPSDTAQNATVQFIQTGQYSVTLIATNLLKTDSALKVNYINVSSPQLICVDNYSDAKSGYLYDQGGKYANYSDPTVAVMYNGVSTLVKWCTFLIQPKCAQSVTLSLLDMDINSYNITSCVNINFGDYLAVYDGTTKSAPALHLSFVDMYNNPVYPFGIQNGPSNTLRNPPFPTMTGTSGSLFVEMGINCAANGAGFEAKWTTSLLTPSTSPKAVFSVPDTAYLYQAINFDGSKSTGYSLEYAWDMNGDGFTDATTPTASYTFTNPGTYIVSLSANSCALSDKKYDTIIVLNPTTKPVVDFAAEFVKISSQDILNIFDRSSKSAYAWKWTITPATFNYMNGTSSTSKDIKVQFTTVGTYTVKLVATNAVGSDSTTKTSYILVYDLCSPSVFTYNSDIGISDFTFTNPLGTVLIHQASDIGVSGYSNYANTQRAVVYKSGLYTFTLKRNSKFNKITRTIWIDYNQDGAFSTSDVVLNDTNSVNQDLTYTITIPTSALTGLARMRVATNAGVLANKPCGPNYTGEYEDYALEIRNNDIKPVITFTGRDTVEINSCETYVEPGYQATSITAGILTSSVSVTGTINNKVQGYYTLTYTVTNPGGNTAAKKRVVQVLRDMIPPVITITGNVLDVATVNKSYTDPGFTATDNCAGIQGTSTTGTVNTNIIGDYYLTYIAWDKAVPPNYDTAIRTVTVVDAEAPKIKLVGKDTVFVEVSATLTDPGVTITDNYYSGLTATVSDNINFDKLGTYFRTYCVTDPSGNGPSCVDRVVIVQDNTRPTIAKIGSDTIEIEVNSNYNEPGVTYSDNYWPNNNLFLVTTGSVNPYVLGSYTLTYKVVDGSGNVSLILTRIVKVLDNTPPQISLLGSTTAIIGRWQPFVDKGVKVIDNYYPASSITVVKNEHGTYQNSLVSGLYSYTYKACDPSGNCSPEIIRYIYVQESISSITEESINSYIKYYPNPVNYELNINIDLPEAMNVIISIYNTLGEKVMDVHKGTIKNDLLKVNTQNLSSGIYYIRVDLNNSEQINKKFIIAR